MKGTASRNAFGLCLLSLFLHLILVSAWPAVVRPRIDFLVLPSSTTAQILIPIDAASRLESSENHSISPNEFAGVSDSENATREKIRQIRSTKPFKTAEKAAQEFTAKWEAANSFVDSENVKGNNRRMEAVDSGDDVLKEELETELEVLKMAKLLSTKHAKGIIISYEGIATPVDHLHIIFEFGGASYTVDFTAFHQLVGEIKVFRNTKQALIGLKPFNKDQLGDVIAIIKMLKKVDSIFIVEANNVLDKITRDAVEVLVPNAKSKVEKLKGGPPVKRINDSMAYVQWQLENTKKPVVHLNVNRAWKLSEELQLNETETLVGVIDDGFDVSHPELKPALWTNTKEILEDGIDNDANGCVDDLHGCAFDETTSSGTFVSSKHGTGVAGVIAAVSNNNKGITGYSASNSIRLILGSFTRATLAQVIAAIDYMYGNNVKLMSCSFGFNDHSPSLQTAIDRTFKNDALSIWAVDNGKYLNASDPLSPGHNDFPLRYQIPHSIYVANINSSGLIHPTSNFGYTLVDIASPGNQIITIAPENGFQFQSGTSLAVPSVTGIAAFLRSTLPELTSFQLKRAMLTSYRKIPALKYFTKYPGILDATEALRYGICEREIANSIVHCKTKARPNEVQFWRENGGKQFSEQLAFNCAATCRMQKCLRLALKTHLCKEVLCDVIEGRCRDVISSANYLLISRGLKPSGGERLGFKCRRCFRRMKTSDVVEIVIQNVRSKTPVAKPGPPDFAKIANELSEKLYTNLQVFEVILDQWREHENGNGTSFVYRLSSTTSSEIVGNLQWYITNRNSELVKSEFGKRYCSDIHGCFLNFPRNVAPRHSASRSSVPYIFGGSRFGYFVMWTYGMLFLGVI